MIICWDLKEIRSKSRRFLFVPVSIQDMECQLVNLMIKHKLGNVSVCFNKCMEQVWMHKYFPKKWIIKLQVIQQSHSSSFPCSHHMYVLILSFSVFIKTALQQTRVLQSLLKPVNYLYNESKQFFSSGLLCMHLKYPRWEAKVPSITSDIIPWKCCPKH